jgi:hypothetical protein
MHRDLTDYWAEEEAAHPETEMRAASTVDLEAIPAALDALPRHVPAMHTETYDALARCFEPAPTIALDVDLADEILAACDAVGTHRPRLIVSGGQTGADRGGLDAAMALGISTDGFCPRGRLAEDGRVPDRYNVRETGTANYGERTALNVRFSDATIIFHYGMLSRGSKLTERLARKMGKARLVVKLDRFGAEHVDGIRAWLNVARPEILNVAGQRESRRPGIGAEVERILRAVWA